MLTGDPGPFGDADALMLEAFRALIPPERLALWDYAARNRRLTDGIGEESKPFDTSRVPYLQGPSNALTSGLYQTVVVPGPGQCAKTTIAENWLQLSVETDPASFLWYMQTHPGVQAYVKKRIEPMIRAHPRMEERLGSDPSADSIGFKDFGAMQAEFLSFTKNNLINKNAARIVADEVDNYDLSELGEAKPVLDIRRQVFGEDSCLFMLSHPDLAVGLSPAGWTKGIMAVYRDSTRGMWWWPCPRCGAHSSPNPGAARFMALDYDIEAPLDEVRDMARLVCPVCGGLIEDHEREAMNAAGRWVGLGETIDEDGRVTGQLIPNATYGAWIVGMMSPFILGGIGGLARERVAAEREMERSGEETTARQVVVKQWGFPFVPPRKVGSVDAETLVERADPALELGQVPEWVRFVTVWADVQANRFEPMWRGWGVGGESAVLKVEKVEAETATDPKAWDALLALMQAPLPLADGSGRLMRPRAVGMDMGGAAGVTSRAYEAWLRWQRAGKVRRLGLIGKRDAWDVILTQGVPRLQAARLEVVYPDEVRKARAASAIARGQVPVARFNANLFKDDLSAQLTRAENGPWYVHFPDALKDRAGPPHPWFEQLVAEQRMPNGTWRKAVSGGRNEAGDQMVGTHVLARLHGLGRINWDAAPAWAAPHDSNTLVAQPPEQKKEAAPAAAIVSTPKRPLGARLA
ncbi:phage terminase large subunit family protein [Roseomonas xinghualingensis]|uniref:phage terminase large subunit family protein n=1 Tax=Roseomonas xinghualingensis TaxID=2986475 RepID=UPI0021F12D24|nr:phage terminase large subunit family protein [Roseomonas sp. SXEYE001]MCV4207559.1 phage terminase large subunit family protein [Roseomonas sp. SXEYE001]